MPKQVLRNTSLCIFVDEQPENDFFDFKEVKPNVIDKAKDIHIKSDESEKSLIKNKLELQLLQYLEDKRNNIEMLYDYNLVKQMFIRYNTNLPSSAPVERMFNFATLLNSSRRHAIADNLFEQLVFLKANL